MKKILSILLIVIIGVFVINVLLSKTDSWVKINGKTFFADIARTDEQKAKGLSVYNKLPLEKGMVFIFDNPNYYDFWMKDMKFPIDIIYIRKNKIVGVFKNIPAPKTQNEELPVIRPKAPADTVLEINAGLSDKYNLKIGDSVITNY